MVARSVETRGCGAMTRGQISCETHACRQWRHLIAVCTSTDLVEASTEPAINSLDAQKCGGRGMPANTQVKRHVCEVSGSTAVCLQRNIKATARGTRGTRVQAPEAPKSSLYRDVPLSTIWMHRIMVAEAWIRILSYGGTGMYSLQPQGS